MFPELNGPGNGYHNPSVVSAVELSNGKQYQFRYNSNAELTRVVLPTGGAIEYDYAAGLTDSATGSGVVSGPLTNISTDALLSGASIRMVVNLRLRRAQSQHHD